MDVRNVQKTGNMFYVYLPTSWCKEYGIKAGSKVNTVKGNDGSLAISTNLAESELSSVKLKIHNHNLETINQLIIACYLNPLKSFTISLDKEIDISQLLLQKRLISIELIEFDKKNITCESSFTVDDPLSLLKTMVKKIKNLIYVMKKHHNKDLIERYEEEIDKSYMYINKSVISMMTHSKSSRYKIIELHYMSNIARDLERLVDHLKEVDSDQAYLTKIEKIIDYFDSLFGDASYSKLIDNLTYRKIIEFTGKVSEIPFSPVKNELTYHKVRVKAALESISEILLNWSITEEMYHKSK